MKNPITRLLGAIVIGMSLLAPADALANETDTGRWSDEIDYIRSHGVSVIRNGDGPSWIVVETTFGTDRAPDMRLHLGKDGVLNPAADLGPVAKIRGVQVFEAPATIDISDFNELHFWNVDEDASIGVAPLR